MPDSSISKFFEKTRTERLDVIKNFANLSEDDIKRKLISFNRWKCLKQALVVKKLFSLANEIRKIYRLLYIRE